MSRLNSHPLRFYPAGEKLGDRPPLTRATQSVPTLISGQFTTKKLSAAANSFTSQWAPTFAIRLAIDGVFSIGNAAASFIAVGKLGLLLYAPER